MEIIDPDLHHLNTYFEKYSGILKPGPDVRGMYYYDKEGILYDTRLKYLIPEAQFFVIMHAILHIKYAKTGNKTLIEIYEQIDPAAIQRAVNKFPNKPQAYFADILIHFLLKHPGAKDRTRISNLKRILPFYSNASL